MCDATWWAISSGSHRLSPSPCHRRALACAETATAWPPIPRKSSRTCGVADTVSLQPNNSQALTLTGAVLFLRFNAGAGGQWWRILAASACGSLSLTPRCRPESPALASTLSLMTAAGSRVLRRGQVRRVALTPHWPAHTHDERFQAKLEGVRDQGGLSDVKKVIPTFPHTHRDLQEFQCGWGSRQHLPHI